MKTLTNFNSFIGVLAAFAFALPSHGNQDRCPPLTKASMTGTWEAVEAGPTFSVYQLIVTEKGDSFLLNIWDTGHSKALVLQSTDVVDGRVRMVFRTDDTDRGAFGSDRAYAIAPTVLLEGDGFDCGPVYALFTARAELAPSASVPAKVIILNFVRTNSKSVTESVREMSRRGKELAEKYSTSSNAK